jgi:hypothetical protein
MKMDVHGIQKNAVRLLHRGIRKCCGINRHVSMQLIVDIWTACNMSVKMTVLDLWVFHYAAMDMWRSCSMHTEMGAQRTHLYGVKLWKNQRSGKIWKSKKASSLLKSCGLNHMAISSTDIAKRVLIRVIVL